MPFQLVDGVEAIMPMEYIIPSLRITVLIGMKDREALEERLTVRGTRGKMILRWLSPKVIKEARKVLARSTY